MSARKFFYDFTLSSGLVINLLNDTIAVTDLPSGVVPLKIGQPVQSANNDGSILLVNGSGNLAEGVAGDFIYDSTGSLGQQGTACTLYIGGSDTGQIALWDASNGQYESLYNDNNTLFWPGGTNFGAVITGIVTATAFQLTQTCSIVNSNSAAPLLVAEAASGQSVDIVQILDNSAATLHRFNKDGYSISAKDSAPADADLAAGEFTFWMTETIGLSTLNIKAKNSAGTVVTGSIALS